MAAQIHANTTSLSENDVDIVQDHSTIRAEMQVFTICIVAIGSIDTGFIQKFLSFGEVRPKIAVADRVHYLSY